MSRPTSTDRAAHVPGAAASILCRRCGREVTARSTEDLAEAMLAHSRTHPFETSAVPASTGPGARPASPVADDQRQTHRGAASPRFYE